MTNSIHSCLDGETPLDALTGEEQQQVARLVATLEIVAKEVRAAPAPELAERVMEAAAARPLPQVLQSAVIA